MTHTTIQGTKPVKPFVKRVGGKRQLLADIFSRMPTSFNNYYEPFVGGGAVLLELINTHGYQLHGRVFDINSELVNTYNIIKHDVHGLIEELSTYVYDKDFFLELRALDRTPGFASLSAVKRAARFIYLNRTCFNGLYRVNSQGQFNVPFGRYTNPKICDTENLLALHDALQYIHIENKDFADILEYAEKGDFIYLDPPYDVLSDTANFTSYNKSSFGRAEQKRLANIYTALHEKGCFVMLSNHNTPFIQELYNQFNINIVHANRAINSNGNKRGKVEEVLVLNY